MTQNIYDNPGFFAGYSQLRRSVEGLDGMPEWPTLRTLVPDLKDKRVVDLGCGFGWFCRWARQAGAAAVLGLDVSENMLARARATDPDDAVTYRREDLERLELTPDSVDLAYSALALHYIADLEGLLARLHQALAPGGRLVASVEHPIYTAPSDPKWVHDEAGRDVWPVDRYLDEGPRVTDWLAKGVVKQHRSIGTYTGLLLRAGFTLSHLEEWGPTAEQIVAHPDYAIERQRPAFLLLAADRR